ncbi:MAG: glycosyl hydrolase [Bacteroidota bacterium]
MKSLPSIRWGQLICLSICALAISCKPVEKDWLKAGFLEPPDSAKPGVYWYFLDGNLDKEQMTADLESMKKAGLGYALFLEVNQGLPRGTVDFLSPKWQELFTHAVRGGERLGIRILLGTGPGWTGSGGPWVKPEQSMQYLVTSSVQAMGPITFKGQLPVPGPKYPLITPKDLPDSVRIQRENWYEDVVTLAFPSPAVKKLVDSIDFKALYIRGWYSSQDKVVPFYPAPVNYKDTPGSSVDPGSVIDLTDKIKSDGTLEWEVPAGRWTIMRFGRRNNGILTRPAPVPGLGLESDKFDTASVIAHYQAYIGKLVEKVKPRKVASGGGWTMLHFDSWEIGPQNWTRDFREEFRSRRGYDPTPYLPAYTGLIIGSLEKTERFLWDVRRTSQELVVENHGRKIRELGQKDGLGFSIQPYDQNPAGDLDWGGEATVPSCEFWSDGTCFVTTYSCIEATSIAHTLGKPVVQAEAFTACDEEAWKVYPTLMKNQSDWAFAMGINRFLYHTFVHKAHGDKYPPDIPLGEWGLHYDRLQTWWPMAVDYHRYVARCQYVLSQGTAVSEILYLTPEGAPNAFRAPVSATEGTRVLLDKKGYSFDGCSPVHLMEKATVKDHRIVFPGGTSYGLLVLPYFETMTPELLAKIQSLVNDGAIVVGPPPVKSPSLANYPDCDKQVADLSTKIWGTLDIPAEMTEKTFGQGKLYWGGELIVRDSGEHYPAYDLTAKILHKLDVRPDFTSEGSVRYIHHSLPDREIYFISNRTEKPVTETCTFRDGTFSAELWDANTGEIRTVQNLTATHEGIEIDIEFAEYQSYFVVFMTEEHSSKEKGERRKEKDTYTPLSRDQRERGRGAGGEVLSGSWTVSFDPRWGGPESVVFEMLTDWTQRPEEGIKNYSGIATYSKTFDLGDDINRDKNIRIYLNLGVVKNMARVWLNGKDLGVVWCAPWQVEITKAVKAKGNKLKIGVANLWPNRMIGDENEPYDGVVDNKWPDWLLNGTPRPTRRYTFTTYRYYKKGDPLLQSGLLGPVSISASWLRN